MSAPTSSAAVEGVYEIKDTGDGKGQGMFALKDINPGDEILTEDPLLMIPVAVEDTHKKTPDAIWEEYKKLSGTDKGKYDSLYHRPDALAFSYDWNPAKATVAAKFDTNAFGGGDMPRHVAYLTSRINHSCIPNANYLWFDHTEKSRVRAIARIPKGGEILITSKEENFLLGDKQEEMMRAEAKIIATRNKACKQGLKDVSGFQSEEQLRLCKSFVDGTKGNHSLLLKRASVFEIYLDIRKRKKIPLSEKIDLYREACKVFAVAYGPHSGIVTRYTDELKVLQRSKRPTCPTQ